MKTHFVIYNLYISVMAKTKELSFFTYQMISFKPIISQPLGAKLSINPPECYFLSVTVVNWPSLIYFASTVYFIVWVQTNLLL